MGKKRTQVKISSNGKKSQKEIFTAVAKLEGVAKLEMDATKGILTVVGEVEPVPIFKALKKIGVKPEILTVGPPKPQGHSPYCWCSLCRPQSDQQQTLYGPPPCSSWCNKPCCNQCELVSVRYPLSSDYGSGQCSIL